jgi:hypothetical protein
MAMGWVYAMLLMALGESSASSPCTEEVDLIELNHFHDCLGRHVYDQVIFYEWSDELQRYHVRAWCLVEDRETVSRRPTRSYTDNRVYVRWHDRDQNLNRHISSKHYRESWTQVDPERANKKLLDERLRTSLVKRSVERPKLESPPSESLEPMYDAELAQQTETSRLEAR